MENFNIGVAQIQGGRDYQDDTQAVIKLDSNSMLLILADGMGGYAGGKFASETIVNSFKENFKINSSVKDALYSALIKANEDLRIVKENNPKYSQMGTTLIAVYMSLNSIEWVSVGDSPLWVIRKKDDNQYSIKRVNANHSIAGLLELQYKHGEITKEDMENASNKHVLTSAITGEKLKLIDKSKSIQLQKDDVVILASDGVETLSEKEIVDIVANSSNYQQIADNIMRRIEFKGVPHQDNATIIVASPKERAFLNNTNKNAYVDNIVNSVAKSGQNRFLNKNILLSIIAFLLLVILAMVAKIYINKTAKVENNTTKEKVEKNIKSSAVKKEIKIDNKKSDKKAVNNKVDVNSSNANRLQKVTKPTVEDNKSVNKAKNSDKNITKIKKDINNSAVKKEIKIDNKKSDNKAINNKVDVNNSNANRLQKATKPTIEDNKSVNIDANTTKNKIEKDIKSITPKKDSSKVKKIDPFDNTKDIRDKENSYNNKLNINRTKVVEILTIELYIN